MANNLPAPVNLGQLNVCVLRAARLNANCGVTGGVSGGIITASLVTMTATPVINEGTDFNQKNGCGTVMFDYTEDDKLTGWTLDGELTFQDPEHAALLFGGTVINGAAAGWAAGKSIGWAAPLYNAPARNGVYLEVVTTTVAEGAGNCVSSGAATAVAFGHIFGKSKLTPGAITFANDIIRVPFTGKTTNNPALYDGPWNDYPGAGYIPNTSYAYVGYSQAQYTAILAGIAPGYVDLPTGS